MYIIADMQIIHVQTTYKTRRTIMNTQEYLEKLDALLDNEDFAEAARNAKSAEELAMLFKDYEFEASEEMVQAMFDKMESLRSGAELTVEDLELVAGGKINWKRVGASALAAAVTVAGASIGPWGAAAGFAAGCQIIYAAQKKKK